MFVKGMYLSVFYCLCYDTDISTDISEEQVVEERDPDLNEMEDIRFDEIWEEDAGDKTLGIVRSEIVLSCVAREREVEKQIPSQVAVGSSSLSPSRRGIFLAEFLDSAKKGLLNKSRASRSNNSIIPINV